MQRIDLRQLHLLQRRHKQCRHSQFWCSVIALLMFMQNIEMHVCRQLIGIDDKRINVKDDADMTFNMIHGTAATQFITEKRGIANTIKSSQPEELFSAPSRVDIEMNYDEYPMVVPKRAALLLDRLMVALHHALEQEHGGHRINQFYANQNQGINELNHATANKDTDINFDNANAKANANFNMYSDDDPNVMLDYDFKDLNSINRATGETLMAKSFQRRANMGVGGIGMADGLNIEGSDIAGNGVVSGGIRRIHGGSGRMYWRCYFNAVSCF